MKRLILWFFLITIPLAYADIRYDSVPSISVNQNYQDNITLGFGNSTDFVCEYDTVQTPDALVCGMSSDSRNMIFTEKADMNTDFGHAQQTNPTIFIHGANAADTTDWISFTHNQTNAVIDTGSGVLLMNDPVLLGAAGVRLTGDGDGAITFLGEGNGTDEDLTLNLDDTSDTAVFTSSTGLVTANFSSIALQESGIGVLNNDEIDASSELLAIMDDETGTGVLVFGTSPTITTSLSQDGDVADAGYLRLQNAAIIGWEADPAGTDETLTLSSGENFQLSGPLELDASDPADAGALRLDNAENIAWENSTPGTDLTLGVDASNILQSSTTFNATALTEATNAVPNATDHLGFFASTTSAQLAGVLSDETGSGGGFVRATSPTLTTPNIGAATAATVNLITITTPATGATLTLADGSTLATSGAFSITLTATGATSLTLPTTGTLTTTSNNLSVFAATTSAQLSGVISDEQGSGALVFANTPTLTTPNIGAATGTSLALTGNITSSDTGDIGWSVVAGANAACNDTCTNGCVLGFADAVTGDTAVACDNTAADRCLCAGAN